MGERTIFITGGTGFVGMNIAHLFLERGWEVILYARKRPNDVYMDELRKLPGNLRFEQGDVADRRKMETLLKDYQADSFVHGAAVTPDRNMETESPELVMDVNCMGLLKAVIAAKNCGVRRFLYLGSISAYGETAFEEKELDEDRSVGRPRSLYEISKYTSEKILLRLKELYGMDAAVARIGDVYGPWERYTGDRVHMSLVYQATRCAMRGERVILPRPCMQDWAYGTDIAGEVFALITAERLKYDIYPLCSGKQWSLLEWCGLLKEAYPGFSCGLASAGEKATIQVNQQLDNAPMSLCRLQEDTGYVPEAASLHEGFSRYMRWLECHGGFIQ